MLQYFVLQEHRLMVPLAIRNMSKSKFLQALPALGSLELSPPAFIQIQMLS